MRFFGGQFLWSFFGAGLGKFRQKLFAPPKFACSSTSVSEEEMGSLQ